MQRDFNSNHEKIHRSSFLLIIMNTNGKKKFSDYINTQNIICKTNEKKHSSLLKQLIKKLYDNKQIADIDLALNQILEREKLQNTVIADGLSLPHARLSNIDQLIIAIATSEKGVQLDINEESDENLIHCFIMILAPLDAPALYLEVLSSLSRIASSQKNFAKVISSLGDPDEIFEFFKHEKHLLPDYVCASDIMKPCTTYLKETDSLKKAINFFIKHDLAELPVIDSNHELVGVVSAHELMKVCLPDYILWMDDLSPIINFEPFSNLLRNESTVWLAEIMSNEFAIVNENSPAIEVAKEITKKNTSQAYVIKNKQLKGVITLQQFLNKVFRE